MRYATPEAGRESIEPPRIPKIEQKAIAAVLLGAKGQKNKASRAARKQVAACTMIGLFHLEENVRLVNLVRVKAWPTYRVATTALARRPIILVLREEASAIGSAGSLIRSIPVHNCQEPECAKATITGSLSSASSDNIFGAEAIDLCPLCHVEGY